MKQAKAFEEKHNHEKIVKKKAEAKIAEKDKRIVKLKSKLSKLNKRTSNIKKATVVDFKELAEFEYEKGVAIDKPIRSMIWTLYKRS